MRDSSPDAAEPMPADVDLCLTVHRSCAGSPTELLASTAGIVPAAGQQSPNVATVPVRPVVKTNDQIRIQISVSQPGYVTVFNISPMGEINVLYPLETTDQPSQATPAHQTIHVMDVALTPPPGVERLFAVWNAWPYQLGAYQLRELARRGELPGHASTRIVTRSTRPPIETLDRDPRGNWIVVALELDHQG